MVPRLLVSIPNLLVRSILLLTVGASLACGGPTEVEVTTVRVDTSNDTLTAIGETLTVTATALDETGTVLEGATLSWSSADPLVATVVSGVITARGNGTTFVIASAGGARDSTTVVVDQDNELFYTCFIEQVIEGFPERADLLRQALA